MNATRNTFPQGLGLLIREGLHAATCSFPQRLAQLLFVLLAGYGVGQAQLQNSLSYKPNELIHKHSLP